MSVKTAYHKVEWMPASSWVEITGAVLDVSGGNELTGNRDNALAFGDSSDVRATIKTNKTLASSNWARTPARVTFSINGVPGKAFAGIIVNRDREGAQLSFSCTGYADLIRATKAYSKPVYLRPVATKTTTTSIEDPSVNGYAGGLINWIFWTAGGRPLEQNFNTSYIAAAKFWYSCDQAAIAPTWSWVAGEDGWSECQKLAQAAGGQMFQRSDGTICYRQPYGYADATPLYLFDESVYSGEPTETASAAKLSSSVRIAYVQRAVRPMQKVAEDSTPRRIKPSTAITIVVEPSWPITSLELNGTSLVADAIKMTLNTGEAAVLGTHYTATAVVTAQRVTLTITSTTAYPLQMWGYLLRGTPILPSESGSVLVGTEFDEAGNPLPQRSIDDNIYIQSEPHARRLAYLFLLYYASPRPVRQIKGCAFDPVRTVGEVVNLTITDWGITAQPHIILSITHDKTGLFSDYQLAYVGDLPKASDYFQIGPNHSGQTKKISY